MCPQEPGPDERAEGSADAARADIETRFWDTLALRLTDADIEAARAADEMALAARKAHRLCSKALLQTAQGLRAVTWTGRAPRSLRRLAADARAPERHMALIVLSEGAREAGRPAEAIQWYQRASTDPDCRHRQYPLLGLASCLRELELTPAFESLVARALVAADEDGEPAPVPLFLRSFLCESADEGTDATSYAERALMAEPRPGRLRTWLWRNLVRVRIDVAGPEATIEWLARSAPGGLPVWAEVSARALTRACIWDWEAAFDLGGEAVRVANGEDVRHAQAAMAYLCECANYGDSSERWMRAALRGARGPIREALLADVGDGWCRLGCPARALRWLALAWLSARGRARRRRLWYHLLSACYDVSWTRWAARAWARQARVGPCPSRAQSGWAIAAEGLIRSGRAGDALASARLAVTSAGGADWGWAKVAVAWALVELGRTEEAMELLAAPLRDGDHADHEDACAIRGLAFERAGRYADAAASYGEATNTRSAQGRAEALLDMARVLSLQGDDEPAAQAAWQAVACWREAGDRPIAWLAARQARRMDRRARAAKTS